MIGIGRRALLGTALALPWVERAGAQGKPRIKVGVLTDLSGPYRDIAGVGSIACARQAMRDFARSADFDVSLVSADHRNDSGVGVGIARSWCAEQGVDMIIDVPNSEVALAVSAAMRELNKVYINCGAGSEALTGSACSPNTVHWSYNNAMLAKSTGGALVRAGGTTWFFITAGYLFGRQLREGTSRYVIEAGGRIQGAVEYKFPGTTDFAPFVREAAQSGAEVLGLANAGSDAIACVRQARQQGIGEEMRIACLLMQIADIHRLGLKQAAGLVLTESFYWDLNDRTRSFTQRLIEAEAPPFYPDMIQAGCYAGTLHYLKAVAAIGAERARRDGAAVVAKMKAMPTDDDAFGQGSIRADGRAMFPGILFQVKSPEESAGPWDYYRQVSTLPAEQAFEISGDGGCSLAGL